MAWIDPVMVRNTSRSTPESANCLKRIAPPREMSDDRRYYSRSEQPDGYSQRPVPSETPFWRLAPANWRLRLRRLGSKGGRCQHEDGIGAIDQNLSARRAAAWSSAAC